MEVEEEAAAGLLIHTITLHFLGNPKEDRAAAKSVSSILDVPLLQIIGGTKMSFSQMSLNKRMAFSSFGKKDL